LPETIDRVVGNTSLQSRPIRITGPSNPEGRGPPIGVPQSDKEQSFWKRANNTRTMRIPKQPNLAQAVLKSTEHKTFPIKYIRWFRAT